MTGILATVSGLAAGAALALALPGPVCTRAERVGPPGARAPGGASRDWVERGLWALGAGVAGALYLPGRWGLAGGLVLAGAAWWARGRVEPSAQRRAREAAAAQLPHLVLLLAAALRHGAAPGPALDVVCTALPGGAADRLAGVRARLALGADPAAAYAELAADPVLAPLGRTLARAHASGAPVAAAVETLAAELARARRAHAEDAARGVGVRAALPLGLCLLPGFLLLGIVPVVAGLVGALGLR